MHFRSAMTVLNKILEDNRHKQEMDKMEQEMKLELTKHKEELNAKLEEAMEKELEVNGTLHSQIHVTPSKRYLSIYSRVPLSKYSLNQPSSYSYLPYIPEFRSLNTP